MTPTELLKHWRFRVHRVQLAHYEAGRVYGRYHILLGLPAIVLSTIVGTAVFATAGSLADEKNVIWISIVLGLLSVISAVLVSLQTFLKYSDLAEKHRLAGARSANLKHRIEILATIPPENISDVKIFLTSIENEWSKFREDSPNIPSSMWKRIERSLTYEDHEKRYPDFGEALPLNKD